MSDVTAQIKARPHWDVSIAPTVFNDRRLNLSQLTPTIEAAVVSLRGWPLPYISGRPDHGHDYVGKNVTSTRVPVLEAWRMFTSGQFTELRVISADLEPSTAGQAVIEVWEVLFHLVEVYELAARLALGPAGSASTSIDASLRNIAGRQLISGVPGRHLYDTYAAPEHDINHKKVIDRDQLIAEPRQLAADAAVDMFWHFGWVANAKVLLDYQADVLR